MRAYVRRFDARESGIPEPICVLGHSKGAALFRIDQHVDGKQEREGRPGSLVVRYHVYNDYATAGPQRTIEPPEEIARRALAFGVNYVTQQGQIVTFTAKVHLF